MNLGKAIKMCRGLKKMTQAQLAQAANISVSYLCLLEKNNREPSITTVASVAEALGVPLSVLVFLAADPDSFSELNMGQIEGLTRDIKGLMAGAEA